MIITPSQKLQKIKQIVYRLLTPEVADRLRNFYRLKDKYFFDKKLANKIQKFIDTSKLNGSNISNDIEVLKFLHELFPTINLSSNYKVDSLKDRARGRYKYLASKGINLKNKDVFDFGAGYGESLMVAEEFSLNSAVGLDYSRDRFQVHEKKISKKESCSIEFRTLDLVQEDIGKNNADIVLSFSAFEHFESPSIVLDKCHRLLRKGGYLYTEFAAFNAPYAIHRKIFSGVPHIQNIFNDSVVYEFFYDFLKINEGVNRYTNEKITDGNPYPEVNRLQIDDYENIFLDRAKWEVINYTKVYNYNYKWFLDIFPEYFQNKNKDELYVDYLKFLVRKK